MPVTYFSSTGALSFAPVAPRDQAVGPMAVAPVPTPPDEIIGPREDSNAVASRRYRTMVLIAALTGMSALLLAG